MKYDNYIFDLYGTLADIKTNEKKPSLWKKSAEILTAMGFPYSPKGLQKDYLSFVDEEARKIAPYHLKPEIELRKVFRQLLSPWCPDETIDNFAITFRILSREYIYTYEDTHKILSTIKKSKGKIYLLSNAQSCFTVPELKSLGIYDFFDDIFISSDMECAKPDPDFMDMLLKKHKLDISKSIMIGNEKISDIAIANSFGMDSMYIHTLTSSAYSNPSDIAATYMDLTSGEPTLEFFKNALDL